VVVMTLEQKRNLLERILTGLGKVVVAYSGGVDSTFLLKAAEDVLGAANVLACTSVGVSEPTGMFERAAEFAESIGVEMLTVEADELGDPNFTANKADRCFHCKSHLCKTLLDIAAERGFEHVAFGANYDDLDDFRPGNRAMKVFGIRSPLAEAELTKDDIRELSRRLNLPTADQPASPCLASRLVEFRVRHHDTVARIEVRPEQIEKIAAEPIRSRIVEKLKSLGFKFVTIDLQGFRSGSLNIQLSEEQKRRSMEQG